ncbi:MAG: helical backbone metal receptor [Acidimicrobiales bacterium]
MGAGGPAPPRVVSLVPSVTETLAAWGIDPIACTRFCERPDLRPVGGTKDPDVAAIVRLAPDVVVMCDEENRREDADALTAAGVTVHSCSPRSVGEVASALAALARRLHLDVAPSATPTPVASLGPRAFVPVWRRPWMTLNSTTYGSDVLACLGVVNVFADSAERYPGHGRRRRARSQARPRPGSLRALSFRSSAWTRAQPVRSHRVRRRSRPVLVGRPHPCRRRPPP